VEDLWSFCGFLHASLTTLENGTESSHTILFSQFQWFQLLDIALVTFRNNVKLFHEMLVAECVPHFIMNTEDSSSTLNKKLKGFTLNNFEVLGQKLQEQKNNKVLRDFLAKKGICLDELTSICGVLIKGLRIGNKLLNHRFGPIETKDSLDTLQSEVEKIQEEMKKDYEIMLKILNLIDHF